MTVNNYPVKNLASKPLVGLEVSRASNTTLQIAAGMCRDSSNRLDITVGSDFPNLQGATVSAPLTVNAAVVGANGLDQGTFAASKVYAVYVIADSQGYKNVAGLLSLASNSAPKLPNDYNAYRLVGYAVSDASTHFLAMYQLGSGQARKLVFDAPQATAITAGASTSYADVDLSALVPPVENVLVSVVTDFNANAAADVLNLKGFSSTGDAVNVVAQVAGSTAHLWSNDAVLSQLDTATPKVQYKVSAGAVAIHVAGFEYWV